MSEENNENHTDVLESTPAEEGTWLGSVREFEAEASEWLTPADRPQLKALYALARQLDAGSFQAALISQFTLIHRALLARRPGGKDTGGAGGMTEGQQILSMFESNPAVWRG